MTQITLHGLRACDTCRKAMKALHAAGRDAVLRDLRDAPPDHAEVAGWAKVLGPGLMNTRSTTWRGLDEAARAGDSVDLMVAHPTLIKRPVVALPDGTLHLGWTPGTRGALGL